METGQGVNRLFQSGVWPIKLNLNIFWFSHYSELILCVCVEVPLSRAAAGSASCKLNRRLFTSLSFCVFIPLSPAVLLAWLPLIKGLSPWWWFPRCPMGQLCNRSASGNEAHLHDWHFWLCDVDLLRRVAGRFPFSWRAFSLPCLCLHHWLQLLCLHVCKNSSKPLNVLQTLKFHVQRSWTCFHSHVTVVLKVYSH